MRSKRYKKKYVMSYKKKQGTFLFIRAVVPFLLWPFVGFIGLPLLDLFAEGELAPLGLVLDIIFLLIVLISIVISIGAIFIAYCSKCKWVPTFRIFLSLFDRTRRYAYVCPKCKGENVF